MKIIPFLILLTGCITVEKKCDECPPSTHTTIIRRPLPTQDQIMNNPLWQHSPADEAYERRMREREMRHRKAVKEHRERLRNGRR